MAGWGATPRGAAAAAAVCTLLLGAGSAADPAGALGRESAPRTVATSGLATAAARRALAAQYLMIATAGNRRLEADFDPLDKRDRNDLVRAQADLRDAASTERLFDRRLLRIAFPPEIERVARELYNVNQARARLTAAAAASTTLPGLHSYEPVLNSANGPVERAVATIRRQLGLPPPSSS
jgi:hypothetical protein